MLRDNKGSSQTVGRNTIVSLCAAALMVLTIAAAQASAQVRQPEPEASPSPKAPELTGRMEYLVHCASCHGIDGLGDGPVAEFLKQRPTNLTLLAKRNGGIFPERRAFDVIDGTRLVSAHGTREMPVWGDAFERQASDRFNRAETKREVRERIDRLIDYLKSIQRK